MKLKKFKKTVSSVLAVSITASLIGAVPVAEAGALAGPMANRPEPDLNGYSKEATYNITVDSEDRQRINDWGVCLNQGNAFGNGTRGDDRQASWSAAANDAGITMFRIGMPENDCYNPDKTFNEEVMQGWLDEAIAPFVENGMTKYMISCWFQPEWMCSRDARGWHLLLDEYLDDYVEWIFKVLQYIVDNGYPLPYCYSIQNEPRDPNTNIKPAQMAYVSKAVKKGCEERGWNILICNPEGAAIEQQISTFGEDYKLFLEDPEWQDSIDVFAHHSYAMGFNRLDVLQQYVEFMDKFPNKLRWQTEFSGGLTGDPWFTTKNMLFDTSMFHVMTFMGDMQWVGCDTWMFWTGTVDHGGKLFEDNVFYGMGAGVRGNTGTTLYKSEGDDVGVTSYREAPDHKMYKLVYNTVRPGAHVRRLTTDDPTLNNQLDYMVDLCAFDTDEGTRVMLTNRDNYTKHYNINNLEGNCATLYSITDEAVYQTDISYKNVMDGTMSNVEIPPMSLNYIVTSNEDIAAPSIQLDLDSLIIKSGDTYVSRDDEIEFAGLLDERDVKLFINGEQVKVDDTRFSKTIKISETPEFTMYAVDKNGNRSKTQTVKFKWDPNYMGMKLDIYNVENNTAEAVLTGIVNDECTLYANGSTATSNADNTFELKTPLKQGDNEFTIYAVDKNGNKSDEETVKIFCDPVAPEITITSNNTVTDNAQIMVTGKVSEPSKLTVGGKETSLRDDLTFARTVTLNEGLNKVKVVAVDKYKNTSEKTIDVTFTKTENTPHLVEGEAFVRRATGKITLDGKIEESDWKLDLAATKITEGTQDNVVKFGWLWDNNYLYIAVDVVDDKWNISLPNSFNNDSVEIFVNPSNDHKQGYGDDDKQLFAGYVNNDTTKFYPNTRGVVNTAYQRNDHGWTCEISIPWSTIGKDPVDGLKMGIDIVVDDNDIGKRNTCIAWWGTSVNYNDTSGFGTITLTSDQNITYKDIPYSYFDSAVQPTEPSEDDKPEEKNEPKDTGMKFLINGVEIPGDAPIMESNGRIMLPLVRLAEYVGATLTTEIGRRTVFTKPDGKRSFFYDEWMEASINGVDCVLDKPAAELIGEDEDMYVDADFMSKVLEGSVIISEDKTTLNLTGSY